MSRNVLCGVLRFVWFSGAFATVVAAPEDFYRAHLPPGVSMGMSLEELTTVRPGASRNEIGAPSNPQSDRREMVEITPQGDTRVAYWYRFKGRKLGAVTRSLMTARMPMEHAEAGALKVADELKADFALKGQEQVVRTTGTENTVLMAQLWEDLARGLNLYFVATNREITVVVFDPKAFGKADFFVGPEKMKDLDAQAESVRRMTEKAAATPIAIVDLLPKVMEATPTALSAAKTTSPSASNPEQTSSPEPGMPSTQTPMPAVERSELLRPWIIGGILVLLMIVALAVIWKRRRVAH